MFIFQRGRISSVLCITVTLLMGFGLHAEEQRPVVEKLSNYSIKFQSYTDDVRGVSMTYWNSSEGSHGLVLRIKTTFDTPVKIPVRDFFLTYKKNGKEVKTNCIGLTANITSEDRYPTWMLETGNITNIVYLPKGPVSFEALFSIGVDVKEVSLLYNDQVLSKRLKLK